MNNVYIFTTHRDYFGVEDCVKPCSVADICYIEEGVMLDYIEIMKASNSKDKTAVITVFKDKNQSDFIKTILISEGFKEEIIVDFYSMIKAISPLMLTDRVIKNPKYDYFDGVVLGISHAQADIIPDAMSVSVANLALTSQDLFYNYKSFCYAVDTFPEKFRNLKWLVIDLYHYNYFNIDLSRGKRTYLYLNRGGYNRDAHNYSQNKNFTVSYDELLNYAIWEHCNEASEDKIDIWQSVFSLSSPQIINLLYERMPNYYDRNRIITDDVIDGFYYNPAYAVKRFEETIKENIDIFRKILELAKSINSQIKIYTVLFPIYKEVFEREKPYYNPWRDEFESILQEIAKEIPFQHLDLRECDLADNRLFWQDAEHLNYWGALKMTRFLDEYINQ